MTGPIKEWAPDFRADLEKVLAMESAKEPFDLAPWAKVIDPKLYHERMVEELKYGPGGPRAITGALQEEARLYLKARGT